MLILTLLLAAAQEPPSEPPPSPPPGQYVRVDAGLFSPVGFLGASYGIQPSDHLELELGAGYAGSPGLALSGMPKLTIGRAHRLTMGVGLSVAIPGLAYPMEDPVIHVSTEERRIVPWLNLDVGYDYRPPHRGLGFAAAIGFTRALTNRCPGGLLDACRGAPQAHLGFSYWF